MADFSHLTVERRVRDHGDLLAFDRDATQLGRRRNPLVAPVDRPCLQVRFGAQLRIRDDSPHARAQKLPDAAGVVQQRVVEARLGISLRLLVLLLLLMFLVGFVQVRKPEIEERAVGDPAHESRHTERESRQTGRDCRLEAVQFAHRGPGALHALADLQRAEHDKPQHCIGDQHRQPGVGLGVPVQIAPWGRSERSRLHIRQPQQQRRQNDQIPEPGRNTLDVLSQTRAEALHRSCQAQSAERNRHQQCGVHGRQGGWLRSFGCVRDTGQGSHGRDDEREDEGLDQASQKSSDAAPESKGETRIEQLPQVLKIAGAGNRRRHQVVAADRRPLRSGREKRLAQCLIAPGGRVMQRRFAVVEFIRIRTGVDEARDHRQQRLGLFVGKFVSEQRRKQRRVSVRPSVGLILATQFCRRAALQESVEHLQHDRAGVDAVQSGMQRQGSVQTGLIGLRAGLEHNTEQRRADRIELVADRPTSRRGTQRRQAILVPRVGIRPLLQKQPGHGFLAKHDGAVQSGSPHLVPIVDSSAMLDQKAHRRLVAERGRILEGRSRLGARIEYQSAREIDGQQIHPPLTDQTIGYLPLALLELRSIALDAQPGKRVQEGQRVDRIRVGESVELGHHPELLQPHQPE